MKRTLIFALALWSPLLSALGGCGGRSFEIASGKYTVTSAYGFAPADQTAVLGTTLEVNRPQTTAIWLGGDSKRVEIRFTPAPSSEWPSGCPTNISTAQMELGRANVVTLTTGGFVLSKPILLAHCGLEPPSTGLSLFEEGTDFKSAGPNCLPTQRCMNFQRSN